jgi:two-component system sensor histidine kinase YesM
MSFVLKIKVWIESYINNLLGHSFLKKMLICFLVATLLPTSIMLYYTYESMLDKYMSQYAESLQETTFELSNFTDNYYESIKQWFNAIYSKNQYMDLLTQRQSYSPEVNNQLESDVSSIYFNNPEIYYLKFYTYYDSDLFEISRDESRISYTVIQKDNVYKNIPDFNYLNSSTKYYVTPLHNESYGKTSKDLCFTVSQLITDVPRDTSVAIISIEVDISGLNKIFEGVNVDRGESVFVLNKDKKVLYFKHNPQNSLPDTNALFADIHFPSSQGYMTRTINGTDYFVFYSSLSKNPYTVVRLIPIKNIKNFMTSIIIKCLWINFPIVALMATIIILLSLHINKPIKKLVLYMEKAGKGQFGEHIEDIHVDSEIQVLIDRFNAMTDQINQLFNETYRMQLEQKTAEMRALQAQINPHFLYNTLQTIYYMALKRDAYEINAMVEALGDILKYSLKNKDSVVKLYDELEYVKKYIMIQQFRYMDKLKVNFKIESGLENIEIPKMIFQPLVENSIIHGLEEGDSNCCVEIRCFTENKNTVIEVWNSGKTIQPEKLKLICNSLSESNDLLHEGIGLRSCYKRLKYLYDNKLTFQIESTPIEGTLIRITISS